MLKLYTIFHLNLAYSSIAEDERKTVIEKCYWPLLNLAKDKGVPIGLEATAYTIEEINRIDPNWVKTLKQLCGEGKIEFIGSGYCQIIAPLVPAKLNEKNLSLGLGVYQKLLGKRPDIALINEQSFSSSLIPIYKDAGFNALVIDWADAASHNPSWPLTLGQKPQKALGPDNSDIDILWSDATTFQKVQRYVHGEIDKRECITFLENAADISDASLCLYGSDAETFNYRPGRYKSEADLSANDEWQHFADLFEEIKNNENLSLCLPSEVLKTAKNEQKQPLNITTAASPVSVKKQRKYNLARWAVTGRADIIINTACQKIYDQLGDNGTVEQWQDLCFLWSSDFRTHIGDERWNKLLKKLSQSLNPAAKSKVNSYTDIENVTLPSGFSCSNLKKYIVLQTPTAALTLNTLRGLSIEGFSPDPNDAMAWQENNQQNFWIGTLKHCFYKDVEWGSDYYSGHLTLDLPGEHKVTDLQNCPAKIQFDEDTNSFVISCLINTKFGSIDKTIVLNGDEPTLTLKYNLADDMFGVGSLRLGNFTLNPDQFDRSSLYFTCHNGGYIAEKHKLNAGKVEHGKIISSLISSSFGLGLSEGELTIGDKTKQVKISFNRSSANFLGLINCQDVRDSYFCRASLSLVEMDDTSRKFDKSIFDILPKPMPEISITLIKK